MTTNNAKHFIFKLKDKGGKSYYGIMPAKSKRDVQRQVAVMDLFFVEASPCDINAVYQSKMKLDVLLMLTHRLSSLIESGVPILRAMNILWRQTQDRTSQIVVNHMYQDLAEGKKLSESMDRFPNVFSVTYRALICVAEGSGGLVEILKKITEFLEYQRKIVMQTKRATLYPLIVVSASLVVLIGMFTFVVPIFSNVLKRFDADLPILTRVVMGISTVMRSPYFLAGVFAAAVMVFLAYQRFHKNARFMYYRDVIKVRLPFVGKIMHMIAISQVIHSLSMLLSSGRSAMESFEIAKDSADNQEVALALGRVQKQVEQGASLYESFKEAGTFPVLLVEMVGIGESSGKLTSVFDRLSAHFDEEVEFDLNRFFTILEPLLIVMVGLIVIVTLLAIYLPIFSIWKSLSGA